MSANRPTSLPTLFLAEAAVFNKTSCKSLSLCHWSIVSNQHVLKGARISRMDGWPRPRG